MIMWTKIKSTAKKNKKWVALTAVVMLFGFLLLAAVNQYAGEGVDVLSDLFLSENSIILLLPFLGVVILLVVLVLVLSLSKPTYVNIPAPVADEMPETPNEETKDEEEVTDRFCMLSEIERRRDTYRICRLPLPHPWSPPWQAEGLQGDNANNC